GDKSISHRALLLGALARGRSFVNNLSAAADVESTATCLRACGGSVRPFGDGRVSLDGAGVGRSLRSPAGPLDCGNSATTTRLLGLCGVPLTVDGCRITVTPAEVEPFGLRIPGDLSSAAFLLGLAAPRHGSAVRCPGITLNPGRTGVLEVLSAMGAEVDVTETEPAGGVEPVGDVVVRGAPLHGLVIAGDAVPRCIDELPLLAVLATQAEGTTSIRDAAELRAKESDR